MYLEGMGSTPLCAEFSRLHFELPRDTCFRSELELKNWIWNNFKGEILDKMTIKSADEETELVKCRKRLELLEKVAQVQKQYLQSEGPKVVYGCLLDGIMDLMGSEIGFVGETRYEDDGTMYLHLHASTDVAWDEASRKLLEDNASMRFYNMNTLFGRYEPIIANLSTENYLCGSG